MNKLIDQIFSIHSDEAFEEVALEVFRYQFEHVSIYREYCESVNRTSPKNITEIPFLPISFFKSHKVTSDLERSDLFFKSSGTGGLRSTHFVSDSEVYLRSFHQHYKSEIGDPKDQVILALLPSYIEQGDSSLVYMVQKLIEESNDVRSGFVLSDPNQLKEAYQSACKEGKHPVLFGVSYALLDLAEKGEAYSELTIIETGGMKGRRKEITKEELHFLLNDKLNPKQICSEYGMTELLSQAYSKGPHHFKAPNWMRILVREVDDPFSYESNEKTGGINVIDLANVYSCSFIATQDLGRLHEDGTFDVVGRFDHSDLRGCNLLVQ